MLRLKVFRRCVTKTVGSFSALTIPDGWLRGLVIEVPGWFRCPSQAVRVLILMRLWAKTP